MIKNYFKIAWRNIMKYRLSSVINILGLTMGIAVCIILIVFVDYESSFDTGHSKSDQTYRVVQHQKFPDDTFYFNTTPYPLAKALRDDFPQLQDVTQVVGLTSATFNIQNDTNDNLIFNETKVLYADENFLRVFDNYNCLAGNRNIAFSGSNEVVINDVIAKKYFNINDENFEAVIGEIIHLNNSVPLTVKAVIKNDIGNSNYQFNVLLPYSLFEENNPRFANNWSANHQGTAFIVLNEAINASEIEQQLESWKSKYLTAEQADKVTYKLQPITEIHNTTLYGSNPGGYIIASKYLNIIFIVAFFVLGIAIVNFVNLTTAKSSLRYKEVGVVRVLGGSRKHLIWRLFIENSLLVILSAIIGVVIASISFNQINNALVFIDTNLSLNVNHIYTIGLVISVTILLASIYPAYHTSALKPIQALNRKKNFDSSKGLTSRKSLIVFQFVIVQIFVISIGVIGLQMSYFNSRDIGFSKNDILIVPVPTFDGIEVFKNKLNAESSIAKVSFGSGPPMGIDGLSLGTSFKTEALDSEVGQYSEIKVGDENYLDIYDLELIAGRNFKSTSNRFNEFIVNETLLSSLGWTPQEAIGKTLHINEGNAEIIGVVRDYHNNSLQYDITPSIIMNWNSFQMNAFIKINPNLKTDALSNIELIWKDTFKSSVYEYSFLEEAINREYAIEQLIFKGFIVLSILAICIGFLGVFGLLTFILMTKSKEIAIRKVLGSKAVQIVTLISKDFITLISIAFVVATPIAYYFLRSWLNGFKYRIDLSVWVFLVAGLAVLFFVVLVCSIQSMKVALSNPIKSLHTE